MAVYVDNARNSHGRMIMCHMMADDLGELHAMAQRIGLKREWFQSAKTPHYDLSQKHRALALKAGALAVDRRVTAGLVRAWRKRMEASR